MPRVLVVENEPQLARYLVIYLKARSFEVETARNGVTALRLVGELSPDVVLLGLDLPDMKGVDLLRALRAWSRVPILAYSDRGAWDETVTALDAGADDCIIKPFGMDELLARLRAAARRAIDGAHMNSFGKIATEDFTIDLSAKKATRQGHDVRLSPTEWHLLEVLIRHRGHLVGRKQLLHEIWGSRYRDGSNCLRVYMARLRRKLEADPSHPSYLITAPGMGYRFEAG
ncbi:response regulator transcription factor [Streptomyces sp. AV19]|uniref:response regulator transcription factor n=1 Tax=Streptomyces sp. AV19 TaxID=2793068 RepID=UPI0018FE64E6|nr:response regulator transcription factor [Streptomyces sp. AV19]MBH1939101.1 response regulator transcription factor [Streptomyces sp. AV19]MDG4536857.1 response regulator transcription factor [Streptomyces sp. AV19]